MNSENSFYKTKVVSFSTLLIGATILSSCVSAGIFPQILQVIGGVSGNIVANQIEEILDRFCCAKDPIFNSELEELAVLTLSTIILDIGKNPDEKLISLIERNALVYPQSDLKIFAKQIKKIWMKIPPTHQFSVSHADIDEALLRIIKQDSHSSIGRVKAFDEDTWRQILQVLASYSNINLHDLVLDYVAEKIYIDFPGRLLDIFSQDGILQEKSFKLILLSLHKETSAEIEKIHSELQNLVKKQDMYAALNIYFANTRALIEEIEEYYSFTLDDLWSRLKSMAVYTDKMFPVLACENVLGMWNPSGRFFQLEDCIRFEVHIEHEGHLILLERNPEGQIYCLCPSSVAPNSYLEKGMFVLPQEKISYFKLQGIPGKEEILAIIFSNFTELFWLSSDKDPLLIKEIHLKQLLDYTKKNRSSKLFYTEYIVSS